MVFCYGIKSSFGDGKVPMFLKLYLSDKGMDPGSIYADPDSYQRSLATAVLRTMRSCFIFGKSGERGSV